MLFMEYNFIEVFSFFIAFSMLVINVYINWDKLKEPIILISRATVYVTFIFMSFVGLLSILISAGVEEKVDEIGDTIKSIVPLVVLQFSL